MRKNVLLISVLVAALGSGVALAKGGSSGSSGSAMGGSSSGMQKSKPMGGKQTESTKGSQKAKDDAALKEQEREREREQLQLQQKDGSGQSASDPLQTRTQDRTQQQDRIQQQDQVKP